MRENKKLIKQICRLCEKQYRKGFQQGFYACMYNKLTLEEVDKFRLDGCREDYKKVIDPTKGTRYDPIGKLLAEMAMPDMMELKFLFMNEERGCNGLTTDMQRQCKDRTSKKLRGKINVIEHK